MPAKRIITREMIIEKALEIAKEKDFSFINARLLAKELNCSTQPIYWSFKNMDDLKKTLLNRINDVYQKYITDQINSNKYPIYKAYGMGYISFAKYEPKLFQLLFMRSRNEEEKKDDNIDDIIKIIMNKYGLSHDDAFWFHVQMWIYVHGLATQIATNYLSWEEDMVSTLVSNSFNSLLLFYKNKNS